MPRRRVKSQVKANLDLWLNDLFLRDGFYDTVSVGETDIYSRDISQLQARPDPSYADNRVFVSAFKNWVHESGITPSYSITPPIIASGVTVDGTFYPKNSYDPGYDAAYAHSIDYVNGRVIFNNAIPTPTSIQAEFSYKHIWVDFADRFENEQDELLMESMYKDNPTQTGVIVYPLNNSIPVPAMMISFRSRQQEPYELGAPSNVANFQVSLHVWARNSADSDMIEDLLSSNERAVLLGIDFNSAPMPLTRRNDKNPSFTSYSSYASVTSPHFFRRIYIDDISQTTLDSFYNVERIRLDLDIKVYPNF